MVHFLNEDEALRLLGPKLLEYVMEEHLTLRLCI